MAGLADVSPKTVSRVINDEPHVRDELRQRVLKAIEELDYRPNFNARQLRTQKTHVIAFISDDVSISTYAVDMLHGAFKAAWEHDYFLLALNTERNQEMEERAMNLMLERQVEGIVYATTYHRPVTPSESVYQLPTVLADCFVEDRSLPSAVPDEVHGGYTATKTLLTAGHQRVGYMQNADPIPAASGRLAGYKKALAEFNIPFEPELVSTKLPPEPAGGFQAAQQLLALSNRPTALFCFNDRMAVGAYRAVQEANLSIPDDIAVIGFDNQAMIGELLNPPLTTLQLPHYEMGRWAVEHLLQLIENSDDGGNAEPVQLKFSCPLVERESIKGATSLPMS